MRKVRVPLTKIGRDPGKRTAPRHPRWWMKTERRRVAKLALLERVLQLYDGDESRLIEGNGLFAGVSQYYEAWCADYPDVVEEYRIEHGVELTPKIAAERVDKMYYIYQKKRGRKGRGISGQHPDNSPSYAGDRRLSHAT